MYISLSKLCSLLRLGRNIEPIMMFTKPFVGFVLNKFKHVLTVIFGLFKKILPNCTIINGSSIRCVPADRSERAKCGPVT